MVGTRTRIAHRVVCVSVWVSGGPGGHAGSPEEGQLSAPGCLAHLRGLWPGAEPGVKQMLNKSWLNAG